MRPKNKKLIGTCIGVLLLIAGSAAIASYITRESLQPTAKVTTPTHQKIASAQPVQPTQPRCDDKNIVGTIAGGTAGGVVGSQIGKGSGKTAATIGGVIGGAYLGNQLIPTRNVTCPQ